MRTFLVVGLAAGLLGVSASAQAAGGAFCLDYANKQCASPLKDGDTVKLEALSKNAAGTPVLYFLSSQPVSSGQTVFQSWEMAETARGVKAACTSKPTLGVKPSETVQAAFAGQSMGSGACKTLFGFTAKSGGKDYHLHSWRAVYGVGKVAAQALDADGQPVPGTAVHIEIME